ncbi:MAG TPA: hypothetical protein VLH10_04380 [Yinghuangia sp.]|jgi:hypothetical protein|uniref:hypothetical protein n=1 Tax=Yinghuangia sp. YIM S10712 TaxID=3436930 RepID=UPI002C585A40|nr:hypothetical protein [Yinghuangia sp.]
MSTGTVVLIAFGLFLIGGVVSFVKQGMPKGVIVLLGLCGAMSLAAGLLRI